MKVKKLLLITLSCVTLLSCKKETTKEQPEIEAVKYDVNFSVEGFSQGVAPMSLNKTTNAVGDTLKNYVSRLYYNIYNANGSLINSVEQANGSSTFGTISDKVPSGTYNVVIIGTTKGLTLYSSDYRSASIYPDGSAWGDLFIKRSQITVGTSAISQQIRLDREVGALDVTLTDAIPANAAKITILLNETPYILMNGGSLSPSNLKAYDFPLTTADVGLKNKKFSMYVGNTYVTTPVVLRAYDANNGLIVEKTITSVKINKNQRTLLSGALFPTTSSVGTGFTVVVNPIWITPLTPITF